MNFSEALEMLKQGKKIKRKGWGGYWYMRKQVHVDSERTNFLEGRFYIEEMIVAKLVDGTYAPAQAYQSDLLAEDWELFITLKEQQDSCNHEFKSTGFGMTLTSNPPQYRIEWRCDKCGKTDLRGDL